MDFHRARVDVRLEGIVGIGQGVEPEWAGRRLRVAARRERYRGDGGGADDQPAAGD